MKVKNRGDVLDDEQIIELYFAREERAIAETDKKYCDYLHTVAYHILYNEQDADECLQDTYLKTWNSIPPQRPSALRAFLAKITRNLSLDRIEQMGRQKRVPAGACSPLDEVAEFLPDPHDLDSELQDAAVARIISQYLDAASDRRMYIFTSRYFFSLTIGQIAKRLGCSQSLVSKELAAIRQELRERFEEEGITV